MWTMNSNRNKHVPQHGWNNIQKHFLFRGPFYFDSINVIWCAFRSNRHWLSSRAWLLYLIGDDHDGQELNWNEMKWNELKWNEMSWNEMKWNEMKWIEMNWNEMKWNEMKWNEMSWNEMKWNELKWYPKMAFLVNLFLRIHLNVFLATGAFTRQDTWYPAVTTGVV